MRKTVKEKIEAFKKSNKEQRERTAIKLGFASGADYLKDLEKKAKRSAKVKVSKMKGTFYVVDILDATGSMAGGKYNNSKKGIIDGIKDLVVRKDVKYSLVEFIDQWKPLNNPVINQNPSDILTDKIYFSGAIGGDTPLYWAVYTVINEFKTKVTKEDKVLINVYTDGGNNSKHDYTKLAANLIKEVQKENFTITFAATQEDLKVIKSTINIDDSNTLVTANTSLGFANTMTQTRSAKFNYFAKAEAGLDTLVGFYKEEGTL